MKISLVTRSFILLTADHAIAFILNSNAGESFKVGKRRFSHAGDFCVLQSKHPDVYLN